MHRASAWGGTISTSAIPVQSHRSPVHVGSSHKSSRGSLTPGRFSQGLSNEGSNGAPLQYRPSGVYAAPRQQPQQLLPRRSLGSASPRQDPPQVYAQRGTPRQAPIMSIGQTIDTPSRARKSYDFQPQIHKTFDSPPKQPQGASRRHSGQGKMLDFGQIGQQNLHKFSETSRRVQAEYPGLDDSFAPPVAWPQPKLLRQFDHGDPQTRRAQTERSLFSNNFQSDLEPASRRGGAPFDLLQRNVETHPHGEQRMEAHMLEPVLDQRERHRPQQQQEQQHRGSSRASTESFHGAHRSTHDLYSQPQQKHQTQQPRQPPPPWFDPQDSEGSSHHFDNRSSSSFAPSHGYDGAGGPRRQPAAQPRAEYEAERRREDAVRAAAMARRRQDSSAPTHPSAPWSHQPGTRTASSASTAWAEDTPRPPPIAEESLPAASFPQPTTGAAPRQAAGGLMAKLFGTDGPLAVNRPIDEDFAFRPVETVRYSLLTDTPNDTEDATPTTTTTTTTTAAAGQGAVLGANRTARGGLEGANGSPGSDDSGAARDTVARGRGEGGTMSPTSTAALRCVELARLESELERLETQLNRGGKGLSDLEEQIRAGKQPTPVRPRAEREEEERVVGERLTASPPSTATGWSGPIVVSPPKPGAVIKRLNLETLTSAGSTSYASSNASSLTSDPSSTIQKVRARSARGDYARPGSTPLGLDRAPPSIPAADEALGRRQLERDAALSEIRDKLFGRMAGSATPEPVLRDNEVLVTDITTPTGSAPSTPYGEERRTPAGAVALPMKLGAMLKRLSVGGGEADNVYLGTANRLSDLHRTRPQAPATSHPPSEPRSLLHPAAPTRPTSANERQQPTSTSTTQSEEPMSKAGPAASEASWGREARVEDMAAVSNERTGTDLEERGVALPAVTPALVMGTSHSGTGGAMASQNQMTWDASCLPPGLALDGGVMPPGVLLETDVTFADETGCGGVGVSGGEVEPYDVEIVDIVDIEADEVETAGKVAGKAMRYSSPEPGSLRAKRQERRRATIGGSGDDLPDDDNAEEDCPAEEGDGDGGPRGKRKSVSWRSSLVTQITSVR